MNRHYTPCKWYLRTKADIPCTLPFTESTLRTYLAAGIISKYDLVSIDGMHWEELHSVPQLIPPKVLENIRVSVHWTAAR